MMQDLEAFSRIAAAGGHESQEEQSFAPDFFTAVKSDWNQQERGGAGFALHVGRWVVNSEYTSNTFRIF